MIKMVYYGHAISVVRFFGNLGQNYAQQLVADFPTVLNTIFKMTESIEENIFMTSLETIGMIAHSRKGKHLLMTEFPAAMSAAMKRVHASITEVPTDWKVRGLGALGNIVHIETNDTKSDFAAVVQSWFEDMGPQGFDAISEMTRQPFPDIKVAALDVLIQMAPMKWGQTKIASNQGIFSHFGGLWESPNLERLEGSFMWNARQNPFYKSALLDYLLSSEEPTATAHASKVKLLKVLVESESSQSVFGDEAYGKIKLGANEVKENNATVLVEMMSV